MDPRNTTPEILEQWAAAHGCDPRVVRRLLSTIFQRGVYEPSAWMGESQIPKRLVEAVSPLPLPRLTLDGSVVSPVDGFQKLRFRTSEGLPLETVLIPLHKEGAVSLCLSSQVGCAMGCVFCATARMTTRRNLAAWEIIDQFLQARELVRSQGRRVTGAVFMGMGEPFLNYDNVVAAAELLRCSSAGSVAAKAITISTVGLVPEIDRFTREGHRYRLAVSLGAATDAKRKELVPVASRWPVADVMAAARRYALARRDRVTLAYVCISGVNVDEDDARALGELIGDTPVRVDLIEVTDPTGRFAPPTADELRAFRDALSRHVGQPIVRRYSGGKDIQAACGTLAGVI
ncbi:23S rRNA (adenine(2503)-C(2))-methyltransferase RlmN [Paludisphaera borealis]|uniref:Putative dual-specificity RNA methyltransferase RlmN n=1 Tax=Paludisphaera borealis TaxID=1387353 RepID=A0A1U7CMV0_9BACT|nr:radical SAM protein [Paludisphaera borealis]APW60239.1 putative dual-specificity RNA methyltransferase RlmN [Paludisphaera borealis]